MATFGASRPLLCATVKVSLLIRLRPFSLVEGTGPHARGCAKTPAFNLRVENPSRFSQSENQKCWRRLSEEANRENRSALTRLAHVFPQPGPYCVAELYALQQIVGTLKEYGATLVAITPQLSEGSRSLIEKQGITFDLLSDPGNDYAAKLGLRFKLPDDLKEVYLSFGIDLATHNGEGSWTLPMPGRFVVDQAGIVRAVDVDPDYQYRPEPQKTVDDVKALG